MGVERGSVAELAIDRGLSVGDVFECPLGMHSRQRVRVTAIGESFVLGRRCGYDEAGDGWIPDYPEDREEVLCRAWVEGAEEIGRVPSLKSTKALGSPRGGITDG